MFANRLGKNLRRLASWRKREGVECYRVYDADMPEYAVAVDIYGEHVHVAEYKAPASVDEAAAHRRMQEVRSALPGALGVAPENIAYKQRSRQRGATQYGRQDRRGAMLVVREGAACLQVNLHDYLDTGLFLDHRPLRLRIASESRDRDFLNLFAYTGSASVHAGLGGARSTTSVDVSNTYTQWARDNLEMNGLRGAAHEVVRADVMAWLQQAAGQYDLILLDPPSFSNSKSRDADFDVQRDHAALVRATMARLRPRGSLYFSNNRRGFKLDESLQREFICEDITGQTLDKDFERNRKIHQCWLLRHRDGED
jgi:23S rRNA (guanine2445-N2)-methyltransferase / 23S rRNA (guanine2069-N7)-methyltransferase